MQLQKGGQLQKGRSVIVLLPLSTCRQFTLILVICSRNVTHIIYERIHDEAGTRGLFLEYCVKQPDAIFLDSLHYLHARFLADVEQMNKVPVFNSIKGERAEKKWSSRSNRQIYAHSVCHILDAEVPGRRYCYST